MTAADPTETHRLFQHERVAAGYATARPDLHPQILAVVREPSPASSRRCGGPDDRCRHPGGRLK